MRTGKDFRRRSRCNSICSNSNLRASNVVSERIGSWVDSCDGRSKLIWKPPRRARSPHGSRLGHRGIDHGPVDSVMHQDMILRTLAVVTLETGDAVVVERPWWHHGGEHGDDASRLLGVGPPIGHPPGHLSGTQHAAGPPSTLQRHHLVSQRLWDTCGHLCYKRIVVSR